MAKKVTKVRARVRPTQVKVSTSTALALRPADIRRVRAELVERLTEDGVLGASSKGLAPSGVLGEDAIIGMVGQFDIRLTEAEEKVLSEDVNLDDVQIKPTGELYLPHEVYTRWFNRAFGRLGWAIVPAAKPRTNSKSVVVPYVLYVHGKPAATAWGEQEYHEDNARQTLGDAVESTVASALRRIAKRLGVGLELWRRPWLERVVYDRAIPVLVETGYGDRKKTVTQWRLTNQRPLKGELRPAGDAARQSRGGWDDGDGRPAARTATPSRDEGGHRVPAGSDGQGGTAITEKQHKRLWAIASGARHSTDDVKAWIKRRFKVAHTRELRRADYDYVCETLEAPGALPED